MPIFGTKSRERLKQAHPDLQDICNDVIKVFDFSVICSIRTKAEQDEAVAKKHSSVVWPNSKHNRTPSYAVDLAPYPIDWNDLYRFVFLAGHMFQAAHARGIELRWGGNWNGDHIIVRGQKLVDLPHFELI